MKRSVQIVAFAVAATSLLGQEIEATNFIEMAQLKKALQLKSDDQLKKLNIDVENLKILSEACDIQIKESMVPESCYAALKFEKTLFKTHVLSFSEPNVDKLCIPLSRKTKQVRLRRAVDLPNVCRRVAMERVKMNNYKNGHDY